MQTASFTVDDLAAYDADGYLLVSQLFDSDEIELLRDTAKRDQALDQQAYGRNDGEGGSRQIFIKIPPRGTLLRDKLGLPGARPVLDVLFPLDGVVSCVVHLEIGELVNSVSLGTNRFCARTLGARDRW